MSKPFLVYVVMYNDDSAWSLSSLAALKDATAVLFAFGNLKEDATGITVDMGPASFTKYYSESVIKAAIVALHAVGIKAILSINDNGGKGPTHWYDIDSQQKAGTFASNVSGILSAWGFDGVDLDNEDESSAPPMFSSIVPALRRTLGDAAWISAPVYGGNQGNLDLGTVAGDLTYVPTMNYNGAIADYVADLVSAYPALTGKVVAGIGTPEATGNQSTPLGEIQPLVADSNVAGVSLWAVNYSDAPAYVESIQSALGR